MYTKLHQIIIQLNRAIIVGSSFKAHNSSEILISSPIKLAHKISLRHKI